jgi:Tol biopolymer transport system component
LLRCLIILFVIVPFLTAEARADAHPVDEAPAFRIARVIEVTDGSKIYIQPVWSPDGTKLAFSTLPGFKGVYIRNADGSGPIKQVASDFYIGFKLVWTSDSKGIVIQTRTGVTGQTIRYIDIETGEVRDREQPISPDLRLERDKQDSRAWIIADGDGTRITEFPYRASLADLSPTQDRVAFLPRDGNLYVSHLDGSEKVNLGEGSAAWDWSPDGRWIVYVGAEVEEHHAMIAAELFVANPNTGDVLQLTDTSDIVENFPRWSPDGTKVAYSTHMAGKICVAFLESTK